METMNYDADDLHSIKMSGMLREDANESIYFARSLESVKAKTYDVKYAPLSGLSVIPVETSTPEGAESIVYRQFDGVGMAEIMSNYADDAPRADVLAKEFVSPIRSIRIDYGYNVQEIRNSALNARTGGEAGLPLDVRRAMQARKGHDQKINALIWNGDTEFGLPGFLGNANIPALTLAADGTGASKAFTTKTADLIVRDVSALINLVKTQSKGAHNATKVIMPLEQLTYITSLPRSTGTDTTVLEFLRKIFPGVEFLGVLELDGAGAASADRMVSGEFSNENIFVEIPMLFKQHPPQAKNLSFNIPCESRFGGVIIPYPLAFAYADGI